MTEAEKIALAMLNEVADEYGMMAFTRIDRGLTHHEALCRTIEQHEAFKREVSDAINTLTATRNQFTFARGEVLGHLANFIIKPPVDPVEMLCAAIAEHGCGDFVEHESMRKALAARGLQITEVK